MGNIKPTLVDPASKINQLEHRLDALTDAAQIVIDSYYRYKETHPEHEMPARLVILENALKYNGHGKDAQCQGH